MTDSGLTLIEVLMVLLLMSIAATLALPSITNVITEAKIDSAASWVIGDIRYAQSLAIQTQQVHTVRFDAANDTYRLIDQDEAIVEHPLRRQAYQVDFDLQGQLKDVDLLSATFGASSDLSFSALGAPQSGGTVTISYAGRQRVITVTYPTGRVVVQ